VFIPDPDLRIFSSRIQDSKKKRDEEVNLLFPCCLQFQEQVLKIAQFLQDNKTRILNLTKKIAVSEINSSRIQGGKKAPDPQHWIPVMLYWKLSKPVFWIRIRKDPKLLAGFGPRYYGSGSGLELATNF
jgi:hypothetical protein